MKAIFSQWSAPGETRSHNWFSRKHEMLGWIRAVSLARQHYGNTHLVTDLKGKEQLVDKLGLKFDTVNLCLETLPKEFSFLWALGKIKAYSVQTEPYIHIDADVFLSKKPACDTGAAFAQSPEAYAPGVKPIRAYNIGMVLPHLKVQPEVFKTGLKTKAFFAANAGILGFNDMKFSKLYSESALSLALENLEAWQGMPKISASVICEQWMMGATSVHLGIPITFLFPRESGPGGAFDKLAAVKLGYTHLLGAGKSLPELCGKLENRVRDEYPTQYERCVNLYEPAS